MSEKHHNQTDLFPDGSDKQKLSEEYESRTETDSGFLSGGNILVSEEIHQDVVEKQPTTTESNRRDDHEKQSEKAYMHIDSGVDVCLSKTFSNLSLTHPELNDLNASKEKEQQKQHIHSPSVVITKSESQQQQQQPWEIYFEQDEDGDT